MTQVPASFPWSLPLGAVAGAHPKLLAFEIDGQYVVQESASHRAERYAFCADLQNQLLRYCQGKLPGQDTSKVPLLLLEVRNGLEKKDWALSVSEIDWLLGELRSKLETEPPPAQAIASEAYTNEVFRQLVLAHLLNTDQDFTEIADIAGLAASELDELGAGRRDVDLLILKKVGKVFGLRYFQLPKIAERAQLHLQTTGPSPYTLNAELNAKSAKRVEVMLAQMQSSST